MWRSRRWTCTPRIVARRCPRQDSNLRTRLRRAVLYPLSYGGSAVGRGRTYQPRRGVPTAVRQGAGSGVPPRAASIRSIVVTSAACVSATVPASPATAGTAACSAAYRAMS